MSQDLPYVVTCGRDWDRYIIKSGRNFRGRWHKVLPIYATKVYIAVFCKTSKRFRFQLVKKLGSFSYWKTAVLQSKEYARHHNLPYEDDIKHNLELIP